MSRKVVEPRTKIIRVRLTETEYNNLIHQVEKSGLTLAEFIRRCASGRKIISRVEQNLVNELRRQGGLMKLIHNESGGVYSEKTAAAIEEMRSVVRALTAEVNHR